MKPLTRRDFVKLSGFGTMGLVLGCSRTRSFDLIIRNGLVLDGSGGPGIAADIGIRGKLITAVDDLGKARARQVLDASDRVVCPGFIDIHTHTDTELLVNGKGESKIRQGVTTEVSGNCGSSPFPLNESEAAEFHGRLKEKYGLDTDWHDIAGFLQALEQTGISLNYVTLTGQGDLRAFGVGRNDVPPTPEQLRIMQDRLAATMEAGSFGMSTGLEYSPGSYADTEELIELTKVLKQYDGIYATHMRNEDDTVEEAIEEALRIGREAGVFTQISHLKACNRNNWHKVDHMLEMIAEARQVQPVMADRYPYDAWGTGLTAFLPLWARQGETDEILGRLEDPDEFEKISDYSEGRAARIGGWDRVLISSCSHDPDKQYEGKTVLAGAEERGLAPMEFIRDLLQNSRNRVGVVGFAMDEGNLHKVLAADFVMVGSDGSAVAPYGKLGTGKPHPRYYGTFPRVLGKYVREESVIDLATAVKKMTTMPAETLGITDRGSLTPGKKADIVVFDPGTVIDKATFAEPHQYAHGIEHVIVNGVLTIHHGEHNGALSGEVLRKGS